MASELKSCPFCGGTDVNLHHSAKAFMSWVSCKSCGLDAPSETGVTDEEAITYWNTRPAPADLKARDKKRYKLIRKSLQNKGLLPAATDTGLVTVGKVDKYPHGTYFSQDIPEGSSLCLRSQAVELLAAEIRRERDLAAKQISEVVDRMSDDYLALKAELDQAVGVIKDRSSEYEALEAKLAAANEVAQLVIQAEEDKSGDPNFYILMMQTAYDKARAVLGGKPS